MKSIRWMESKRMDWQEKVKKKRIQQVNEWVDRLSYNFFFWVYLWNSLTCIFIGKKCNHQKISIKVCFDFAEQSDSGGDRMWVIFDSLEQNEEFWECNRWSLSLPHLCSTLVLHWYDPMLCMYYNPTQIRRLQTSWKSAFFGRKTLNEFVHSEIALHFSTN